jgi:rhodanese-related sulfurtransferase
MLQLPYGLVVLAVVIMAIGAFVAAEWAEKKFGGVAPTPGSLTGSRQLLNPARGLAAALLGVGLIAAVSGNPYREGRITLETQQLAQLAGSGATYVRPAELSAWIVEGRADYTLVDLRSDADFAKHRIPGARSAPLKSLTADVAPRTEKVVLYAQDDTQAAQAWILLKALGFKAVYVLAGGIEAWNSDVLFPAKPADESPAAKADFEKRVAVAKHFGGAPRGPTSGNQSDLPAFTPPPPLPAASAAPGATPAKKKREGC